MCGKLKAIWKTKFPLQIIDLENNYFSVKFQEEEEYLNALSGGLPEGMCTKSLLKFIGSITGIVAKIDWNTDNSCKGQFARLTVYVELGKSLVSKIIIDGKLQRVEYESLPMVCLDCGRFGHSQEECPHKSSQETTLEGGGKITRCGTETIGASVGRMLRSLDDCQA
ncbi:uncharacterized protein [Gossypium hirsutum]|uniref:CCHC-type domain-containing protein n=1 Tax=Gossypium hirsutum TaxID=3635 RepID=A0A1U8NFP5_GOSHI|nr:uncharacterized protein LOC107947860 [Gossypium hirsutum]